VPFYAGWGLTDDRRPVPARRGRSLTRAQLVAAALILYPTWYDPYRDRLCPVEDVLARLRHRPAPGGRIATAMSHWG
jgi:capsular polysaccharide export protein